MNSREHSPVRLTAYSHGAGCGCKISPKDLDSVLKSVKAFPDDHLLVGNDCRDDAAVYDPGDGNCIVFTTDFFMPVTDDPYDFGRIAAANAISDIFAMGGTPFLALSVLGWPVDVLDVLHAEPVLKGGRDLCASAGVTIAGGHSIDSPEPFYGLAVIGRVRREKIKKNNGAKSGDLLYYTKPLGIGLLSTAEKHGTLRPEDKGRAAEAMIRLNTAGVKLAELGGVHAVTDVTGFGLLGHLAEMCEASGVSAEIHYTHFRFLADLPFYVASGALAKGLKENWAAYGHKISSLKEPVRSVLCDPQTSGGLLIAADPETAPEVEKILAECGLSDHTESVGKTKENSSGPLITVTHHEDIPEIIVRFGIDAAALNQRNPLEISESLSGADSSKEVPGTEILSGPMECAPPRPAKGSPGEMWKMMKSFFKDALVYRKELKKADLWIRRYAASRGLTVNPHWMFYTNLRLWLIESEAVFGKRYCPCFEPGDDAELNRKLICPCEFIEKDIESKGTCHCTLFGRGDLDDAGFREAEARLMREYRVELSYRKNMLYTAAIPTDPYRGLKVPDSFHLVKRAAMLHGFPLDVFTERNFEAGNIRKWAEFKGLKTAIQPEEDGYRVSVSR